MHYFEELGVTINTKLVKHILKKGFDVVVYYIDNTTLTLTCNSDSEAKTVQKIISNKI